MITLYIFGPWFGLPDGSPFVTKAMILLKLAGLEFSEDRGGYFAAPKGKLPCIDDAGEKIADSTLIRLHIEKKYGFDFDAGLSAEQKAVGWAVEKMCEDHVYWLVLGDRWLDDRHFRAGAGAFLRRNSRADPVAHPLAGARKCQARRLGTGAFPPQRR